MSTFLGFGFNMAARDVGMDAAMTSAEKHLESLNDLIDEQNEKKPGIWSKMREGVKRFNIASIAQNMRDLTGETGRLTNNLESMGVANAQAVRPLVAQMNLTAQEARAMTSEISGMAVGMNVGATEIAEVFKAIHQAGPPAKAVIDELGLSQREWVKITTTSGISMAELTGVMGDLAGEWQVAPKRAAAMLNSLVEIGKKTGTGIAALKTATQTVGEFGDIQAKLPAHLRISGEAIAQATEQAYKLAGAYRDMGANEEQAVQLGKDTAKMFMEQSAALKLAQVGLGDIADASLYNKLRQMGVQESKVLEILAVGEQDSVKGMIMLNEEMRKAAGSSEMHRIMMGDLARTLGETGSSLVYLAESADVGSTSLARMDQMAIEGTSGLKKFGDQAFSSGRTMQESFDLAKESFETQIRSIARANVGKLVQRQIGGYRRVGKAVKALGSDETWGPLMNAVSVFDQMGARGLGLAFLDKNASKDAVDGAIDMGIMYEYAFDKVKQFGQEISPLMEMLGMFGPLGPIAAIGGVAALFAMDEEDAKGILGGFYDTFLNIKNMVVDMFEMIPWDKIWSGVSKVAARLWHAFTEDIPWGAIKEVVMPVVKDIGLSLWEAIKGAFSSLASNLSTGDIAIGAALVAGLSLARGGIASIFTSAVGGIGKGSWSSSLGGLKASVAGIFLAAGLAAIKHIEDRETAILEAREGRTRESRGIALDVAVATMQLHQGRQGGRRAAFSGATSVEDIGALVRSGELDEKELARVASRTKDYASLIDRTGTGSNVEVLKSLENSIRVENESILAEMEDWQAASFVRKGVKERLRVLEAAQFLPEVQADLASAAERGLSDLGSAISTVYDTYHLKMGEQLDILREEFEAQRALASGYFSEHGSYDQSMGAQSDYWSPMMEEVSYGAQSILPSIQGEIDESVEGAYMGGVRILGEEGFSGGLLEGASIVDEAAQSVAETAADYLVAHSPIKEGPLSGESPMLGGMYVLKQFAEGLWAESPNLNNAMSTIMEQMVMTAFSTYERKLEEAQENSDALKKIAQSIVQQFGGTIDMGAVEVEGTVITSGEQLLRASLSMPGLAGVTAAVISSGNATRKVLAAIRQDTKSMAEAPIMQKNAKLKVDGGDVAVVAG